MARQMVGDGQDVYRLRVVYVFPDGRVSSTQFFGPYNSIGTARSQQTVYLSRRSVSEAQIQKAHTEWDDVV